MQDYKRTLPHHELAPYKEDKLSVFISLVILVMLIGLITHSCVDAVVKEAENEEQYKRPIYVEQTYERPAAYRMASPTMRQMDHLDALLTVQEVSK